MEKSSVMLLVESTIGVSTLGTEVVSVIANDNNPIPQDWVIFDAPIHPQFNRDVWFADRSAYDRSIGQGVILY